MSVDIEDTWHPSTKLNAIGRGIDRGARDPIPDGVTRDEIEEICFTIEQLYGKYIDELVAETELSRREAQSWALRNLVYEGAEPLSYEAIGLYIWAIGRAREGDPLSRTIVTDYYDRAIEKIERAEATVMRTGPPPYPEDLFEDPTLLWVESSVGDRLSRRLGPEENYNELIEGLLDETSRAVDLEELVDAYREHRGTEYVAVDTVYPDWDRNLRLVVECPGTGDLPDHLVNPETAIVGDRRFEVTVLEDEAVSPARAHLVLYDATAGDGDLEAGIERLEAALENATVTPAGLVEVVEAAGGVGLAVAENPTGAGAHLYPIFESAPDEETNPLQYVERITLDDRSIRITDVTPVSVETYTGIDTPTVLLWAGPNVAGLEATPLPDDPVAQRERFPKAVLWTA